MFPFFNRYPGTDLHEIDLAYILKLCKTLESDTDALKAWRETHEQEYQQLKDLYDDIMAGDFPESIENAFAEWMQNNAADLIGEMIKLVIFNITDDGYFVAYIPESWDEIQFGTTGLDTIIPELQPEYGHLVLSYEASTNAY